MEPSVIRYRLSLLVCLIDTTSGMPVQEQEITLFYNGCQIRFLYKGNGMCALINTGEEPFLLLARVKGFEDREVWVEEEALKKNPPIWKLHLVPGSNYPGFVRFYSIRGCLKGITRLEGVSCENSIFRISRMEDDNIMTIFNPHDKRMDHTFYGLVHQKEGIFEPFTVISHITADMVKIKQPLKGSFEINEPIALVVFGITKEDGSYLFRIRAGGGSQSCLLRYVAEGQEYFSSIDFKSQGKEEIYGWLERKQDGSVCSNRSND